MNGILTMDQSSTRLSLNLQPGEYVIYAKLDAALSGYHPDKAELSTYSRNFADLVPTGQKAYPDLLKRMFLEHAKKDSHNRQDHADGKIWVSWDLLFRRGGFAYIAGGNASDSENNLTIELDEA